VGQPLATNGPDPEKILTVRQLIADLTRQCNSGELDPDGSIWQIPIFDGPEAVLHVKDHFGGCSEFCSCPKP
jgi:hypothetical protein